MDPSGAGERSSVGVDVAEAALGDAEVVCGLDDVGTLCPGATLPARDGAALPARDGARLPLRDDEAVGIIVPGSAHCAAVTDAAIMSVDPRIQCARYHLRITARAKLLNVPSTPSW